MKILKLHWNSSNSMTLRLDYAEFMQWLYVDSNQKFREHVFKKRVVLGAWCLDPHGCFSGLWNKALKSEGNINDPQEVVCTFCWCLTFKVGRLWFAKWFEAEFAIHARGETHPFQRTRGCGDIFWDDNIWSTRKIHPKSPAIDWLLASFSVNEIGIISLWYLKKEKGS